LFLRVVFVFDLSLDLKARIFALLIAQESFLPLALESSCERLLCEVEFWEVLRLKKVRGFFNDGCPVGPSSDCQLANLEK
jgi:hypothetical protein